MIKINEKISYIKCYDSPLSADIGVIRSNDKIWLYDVGNGEDSIHELKQRYNIVLSHFHVDHVGNIDKLDADVIYASKETVSHIHKGIIVDKEIIKDDIHIFQIPSSHAKGCLGLEVDSTYAFVGDALYCKIGKERTIYNAQILKSEIEFLKSIKSRYLLVSHYDGLVRDKDEVIKELEAIYSKRDKKSSEISMKRTSNRSE